MYLFKIMFMAIYPLWFLLITIHWQSIIWAIDDPCSALLSGIQSSCGTEIEICYRAVPYSVRKYLEGFCWFKYKASCFNILRRFPNMAPGPLSVSEIRLEKLSVQRKRNELSSQSSHLDTDPYRVDYCITDAVRVSHSLHYFTTYTSPSFESIPPICHTTHLSASFYNGTSC